MNSTESWLDAVGRVGAAIVAHLAAVWPIMILRCYLKKSSKVQLLPDEITEDL